MKKLILLIIVTLATIHAVASTGATVISKHNAEITAQIEGV